MSTLVVGPQDPNAPTTPTPAPTPVPISVPWNVEVVPGGRLLVIDTANVDRTTGDDRIRPVDYILWTTGQKDTGYNWPRYTHLISKTKYAPGRIAEHVADTARADQQGSANVWARVTEANDYTGEGTLVLHEEDGRVMSTVPDDKAQDNGNRIFHDVRVGASNERQDLPREVGWTAYIRLLMANPLAYISWGVVMTGIKEVAFQAIARAKGGVRAFQALGKWNVAFDASGADVSNGSALRLAAGQSIHLEASCQRGLRYTPWTPDGKGDRLQYVVNGVPVFEITSDGHVMRGGVQIL